MKHNILPFPSVGATLGRKTFDRYPGCGSWPLPFGLVRSGATL
jgi:hypothetical protein